MKKILISLMFLINLFVGFTQPWSADAICGFTNGQQWNNGGAKGCACTWYSIVGGVTTLNCAFGDCGQNALYECVYDCNGHGAYTTNNVERTCDGSADPLCWYNGGGGSAGEIFCQGLALPIELISFKGCVDDGNILLTWVTASELNTSHFILLNSLDGTNFNIVAVLPASGNSNQKIEYRTIHLNPEKRINYYKLIQYDTDGKYEEFDVISVDNRSIDERVIKVTDILGNTVGPDHKGLVIYFLENGEIEKRYR